MCNIDVKIAVTRGKGQKNNDLGYDLYGCC